MSQQGRKAIAINVIGDKKDDKNNKELSRTNKTNNK